MSQSGQNSEMKPGVWAYVCNPSIQEAEAGGLLQVRGQPGLHSELRDRMVYKMRLSKQTKQQKNSQGHNSVVEPLLGIPKALVVISSMAKKKERKKN